MLEYLLCVMVILVGICLFFKVEKPCRGVILLVSNARLDDLPCFEFDTELVKIFKVWFPKLYW